MRRRASAGSVQTSLYAKIFGVQHVSRFDDDGFFWNDPPRVRVTKDSAPRSLPPIPETDWTLPEGPDAYPSLSGQGLISIDVESCDPNLREKGPGYIRGDAYVCGVAIGTEAGYRQYYPVAHEIGPNLPKKHVFEWLNQELSKEGQPKVGANLLYDLEALHFSGVKVAGPFYDIQVAEPLLDETRLSYALEVIAQVRVNEGKRQGPMLNWLRQAFGDNETNIKKNIYRAPSAVVGPYAESDVDLPLRIFDVQRKLLDAEGLWSLFVNLESKLIPMLLAMRLRGVPVDIEHTEKLLVDLNEDYERSLDEIKRLHGVRPDVWAPDSIAKVFDKAGIEYPMTEKTRKPSFRKEWLLNHSHPVAKQIQHVRHIDKFRGTFVQGYILDGHINGKIHGQFHQLRSEQGGTVSGRFSSSLPNLQNIPTRTAEGKKIRRAFIAEKGQSWWKFDWSQIEYRMIVHYAHITGQPGIAPIVERYLSDPNVDYHQAVADLTGLTRSDAKNLNFGLAYGQGIELLCANLGVTREEGERIMAEYHKRAPFIRPLANDVSNAARSRGYITTLGGRRRRFNVWERKGEFSQEEDLRLRVRRRWVKEMDELSGNTHVTDEDEMPPGMFERMSQRDGWRRGFLHKALNALIQGGAADVMKTAMVQIWESGLCDVIGAPHLTVHDELDGSLDEGNPRHMEAHAEVKHIMESCVKFAVPLRADGGLGPNWGALE